MTSRLSGFGAGRRPDGRRRWSRRVGAALATVTLVLSVGLSSAYAYEIPSSFNNSGVGTNASPGSGLTQTWTGTNLVTIQGASTLGSRGFTASDFLPTQLTNQPAIEVAAGFQGCPETTGACPGIGTLTVTFSQPVINPTIYIAGIGANVYHATDKDVVDAQTDSHAILTIQNAGVTLSKLAGNNNFLISGGTAVTAVNNSTSTSCTTTANQTPARTAAATAACGSFLVNTPAAVTSLTFSVSAWHVANAGVPAVGLDLMHSLPLPQASDWFVIVASVPQDYGDAPASYDAGNAARHVIGDLRLGQTVTEDNANVRNGLTSPNAGAGATGDSDDGISGTISVPLAATTFTQTIPVSGVVKAATVAGWIDFNGNGVFDTGERATAAIAAGATFATLTWTGISVTTTGTSSYARFRIGYTAAQVTSPTGPADSGEVEDYRIDIDRQFECSASFVYSVTAAGGIYTTNPTTGVSTLIGSFDASVDDGSANVNALALGKSGAFIWAVDRDVQGKVWRYDSVARATTWYNPAPTGNVDTSNVVAGAINPVSGIYYFATSSGSGPWVLYAFNTTTLTAIGQVGTITGLSANGDFAFDAAGNLYIVSNPTGTAAGTLARVSGLPTTAGSVTLAATALASSLPANSGQYAALGFGANGALVVGAYTGTTQRVFQANPATGALISTATPAGSPVLTDMASCVSPNTMVLKKNLPNGRFATGDQFTLAIGNVDSAANTATTTGTATGVQANYVGPLLGLSGATYTISETAASGSLTNYTSSWSCVDQANSNAVVASGTGANGSFTVPSSAVGGAAIACTITNDPVPATASVTMRKQVTDVGGNNPVPGQGWTLGVATSASTGTVTAAPSTTTAVTGVSGATAPWTLTFGSSSARATVAVSETQQAGYAFKSGSCTVTPAVGSPTTVTLPSSASYDLTGIAPGATVVCTYVNQPIAGSVSWQKVDASGDPLAGSSWTLTGPSAPGGVVVADCVAATAAGCSGQSDTDQRAGYFTVGGLAWGVYTIAEAAAPAGFVRVSGTFTFPAITGTALNVALSTPIVNQQVPPVTLPLTGGVGTDSFLLTGAVLLVLAVIGALARRRRSARTRTT